PSPPYLYTLSLHDALPISARVACLDDSRVTPAHQFNDGQNYHPTNKWVLFGHHFAAISGAGPLIGPVLAIQYGYMPGLLWLLIGDRKSTRLNSSHDQISYA